MVKNILWVDDDLLFYRSYKNELEELAHIDIVKTPAAMWAALDSKSPNYYSGIVLDILLPFEGLDAEVANGGLRTGLALLEMLKSSDKFKKIPILIFTIRETQDVDDLGQKYKATVFRKSEARIADFVEAARIEFGL
jgi:CheY-like chemotaxis protein